MSVEPFPTELVEYARELFAPEDAELRALRQAASAAGMPVGWPLASLRSCPRFTALITPMRAGIAAAIFHP